MPCLEVAIADLVAGVHLSPLFCEAIQTERSCPLSILVACDGWSSDKTMLGQRSPPKTQMLEKDSLLDMNRGEGGILAAAQCAQAGK